jgi:hypothetical protein
MGVRQVAVAESIQQEIAVIDRLQQWPVINQGPLKPVRAALAILEHKPLVGFH